MKRNAHAHARTKTALALAGGVLLIGGSFFLMQQGHAGSARAELRSDQSLYAEMPITASAPPLTASSTETVKVPILVYHIVRPSYSSDSQAVKALAHTPEIFDAEMKYLAEAGYTVIPFSALEDYFKDGTPLPARPIIISFDDGWSDQFEYAFPILEKYHYPATFFVFTNPIGTRGFLTWDDLRAMRDAGMTIGSHSRSHPYLTKITDPAVLWSEIDGSKQTLEKNLGITVREFAYPFGLYDATTTAAVVKAGYVSARGDYVRRGGAQSLEQIYSLSALNAPTTLALFARTFPTH